MHPQFTTLLIFSFLVAVIFVPLQSLATEIPYNHPEYANIDGKPMCTDCHEDYKPGEDEGEVKNDEGDADNDEEYEEDEKASLKIIFSRFNHTTYFTENHRLAARQGQNLCYMCHTQRSCNDCHAVGTELKPSLRDHSNIQRRTHHRGDYLNKHKIDGHVSPISCYRCHGNPKTSKSCVQCHGPS